MLAVSRDSCAIAFTETAGDRFRPRRRCGLGRGFSIPSDTSISLLALIRLRRSNSYTLSVSVCDSNDRHRRLPGLTAVPKLPAVSCDAPEMCSVDTEITVNWFCDSFVSSSCPDFHQIQRYVISFKTEPLHRVRCLFHSFTATTHACIEERRCFMHHNISVHIAGRTCCVACEFSARFPRSSSQTLRVTPCRQGASHGRRLECRNWEGPIL